MRPPYTLLAGLMLTFVLLASLDQPQGGVLDRPKGPLLSVATRFCSGVGQENDMEYSSNGTGASFGAWTRAACQGMNMSRSERGAWRWGAGYAAPGEPSFRRGRASRI